MQRARQLMDAFAQRTGLDSNEPLRRYLWTDAFAVCNFLGLAEAAHEPRYLQLAVTLVDQVHATLGKHRGDDGRTGWLSGLSEAEGEQHPTRAGLRIGKRLPEGAPGQPDDEATEWERDGQYFHYLTRWMHALDQLARATGEARYNRWACELAVATSTAFRVPQEAGPARLCWKMSIDLSRPLVASSGQFDAVDGLISCLQLEATAALLAPGSEDAALTAPRATLAGPVRLVRWHTADPLSLGMLLINALRLAQLRRQGARIDERLLAAMVSAPIDALVTAFPRSLFARPADQRLAFRELGLSLGLHALERLAELAGLERAGDEVRRGAVLGAELDAFWLNETHQDTDTWAQHRDINEVMLASSLAPRGMLELRALDTAELARAEH